MAKNKNIETPQEVQEMPEVIQDTPMEVQKAPENIQASGRKQKSDKKIEIPMEIAEGMASYIEALLFASDEPIPPKSLSEILVEFFSSNKNGEIDPAYLTPDALRVVVEILNNRYKERNQSFHIIEIAGGFQFATLPKYAKCLGILFKEKSKRRLSQSALETLAIIVFKQPISKPDIEGIRGVNSDYVLSTLLEKDLVTIVGRADSVGRPLLYGTTQQFLKHFGLKDTKDLPKLKEIEEIMNSDEFKYEVKRLEDSLKKGDEVSEEGDEPEINPENIPAALSAEAAASQDSSLVAAVEPNPEITEMEETAVETIEPEEILSADNEVSGIEEVETGLEENAVTEEIVTQPDEETADTETAETEDVLMVEDIESEAEAEIPETEEISSLLEDDEAQEESISEEAEESSGLDKAVLETTPGEEEIDSIPPSENSEQNLEVAESDTSQEENIDNADSEIESSDNFDGLKKKSSNIDTSSADSDSGAGAGSFLFDDNGGREETEFPPFIVSPEIMPPVDTGSSLDDITTELLQSESFINSQGGDTTNDDEEVVKEIDEDDDDIPKEDFFIEEKTEAEDEIPEPEIPEETIIDEDSSVIESGEPAEEIVTPISQELGLEYFPEQNIDEIDIIHDDAVIKTIQDEDILPPVEEIISEEAAIQSPEEITSESEIETTGPIENVIEEAPLEIDEFSNELEAAADEESVAEIENLDGKDAIEIEDAACVEEESSESSEEPIVDNGQTLEEIPEEEVFADETVTQSSEEITSESEIETTGPIENVIEEAPLEIDEFSNELEAAADEESVAEIENLDGKDAIEIEDAVNEDIMTIEGIDESDHAGKEIVSANNISEVNDEETQRADNEDISDGDEAMQSDAEVFQDESGYELETSPIMTFRNFDEYAEEEPLKLVRDSIEQDSIYKRRRWNYNYVVFEKIKSEIETAQPDTDEKIADTADSRHGILNEEIISGKESNVEDEIKEVAFDKDAISADNEIMEPDKESEVPVFSSAKFSELLDSVFFDSEDEGEDSIFKGIKFPVSRPIAGDIEPETDIEDIFQIKPDDNSLETEKFDKLIEKMVFSERKIENDEILSDHYLDSIVKKESSFSEIESFLTKDKYLDFSDKKNEIYKKLNTIYTGKQSNDVKKIKPESKKTKKSISKRFVEKFSALIKRTFKIIKMFFTGRV